MRGVDKCLLDGILALMQIQSGLLTWEGPGAMFGFYKFALGNRIYEAAFKEGIPPLPTRHWLFISATRPPNGHLDFLFACFLDGGGGEESSRNFVRFMHNKYYSFYLMEFRIPSSIIRIKFYNFWLEGFFTWLAASVVFLRDEKSSDLLRAFSFRTSRRCSKGCPINIAEYVPLTAIFKPIKILITVQFSRQNYRYY